MSVVEHALRADPAGVYPAMDFATRDYYRHAVEQIAKRGPLSEDDVARKAVELAGFPAGDGAASDGDGGRALAARTGHVGYFLVDRGRRRLERAAQVRSSPGMLLAACRRVVPAHRLPRSDRADHGGRDGAGPLASARLGLRPVGARGGRRPAGDRRESTRGRAGSLGRDVARAAAHPAADGLTPRASRPSTARSLPCRPC